MINPSSVVRLITGNIYRHLVWMFPVCASLVTGMMASAQTTIQPDATLTNSSIVTPNGTIFTITGGTITIDQKTLFHSFSTFSVGTGDTAYFQPNNANLQNIITRVTGGQLSNINGLIKVDGNSNLFLINPSGITFGANASLQMNGSFIASTANSIKFNNGTEFSAVNSQSAPSLLTINVPLGLQYGANPGAITVQGNGHNLAVNSNSEIVRTNPVNGLNVNAGQTLALLGGNINFDNGNVIAPGGNVQIWAVNNGQLAIDNNNGKINIQPQTGINYQNISLINSSSIDTSGNKGGDIYLQANSITLGNKNNQNFNGGAFILANTIGIGSSGNITVKGLNNIDLTGFAANRRVFTGIASDVSSNATGTGGNITLETPNLSLNRGAQISTNTASSGNGGIITVNADNILLDFATGLGPSGLFATVNKSGTGTAGKININTNNLQILRGAQIAVTTFGFGNGGELNLQANQITSNGFSPITVSGLFANTEATAKGNAGVINVTTNELNLVNGGKIVTNTFGSGQGGQLNITANQVNISGADSNGIPSFIAATVQPNATGQGGNVFLQTDQLKLLDGGKVQSSTFSSGNAGNIIINAQGIDVNGGSANGPSALSAITNNSGNGGNLQVNSDNITVENGGQIGVSTSGTGAGGNLIVNSNVIDLIGKSEFGKSGLFANAINQSGNGGTITVNAHKLNISQNAIITASNAPSIANSSNKAGTGAAGDININARGILLTDQGTITAETVSNGNGGNLQINSDNLKVENVGQIAVSTSGTGNAGSLIVNSNVIDLIGQSELGKSGLFANAINQSGNGGGITVNSQRLNISKNAIITASNLPSIASSKSKNGTGNAGNINIKSMGILLSEQGSITAETASSGTGGNLEINSDNLKVENGGQIAVSTSGTGNAGSLIVNSNVIDLIGQSELGKSGLFANAINQSGNGGGITVNANKLNINQNAIITASNIPSIASSTTNPGTGSAGDININVARIFLDNQAVITADTVSGNKGNININSNNLLLRHNSKISTNSTGTATGGNINIKTDNLVTISPENNDITANSVANFGGKIVITAAGIFGTQFRSELTPLSDITASSELGAEFNGVVEIKRPDDDPIAALNSLPNTVTDLSGLIDQSCPVIGGNFFAFTGRGGLPESPNQTIISQSVWQDFRNNNNNSGLKVSKKDDLFRTSLSNQPVVEAQSWVKDDQGNVSLIAKPTEIRWESSILQIAHCVK